MKDKPLYKPFVSTATNKKYSVYVEKDGKTRLIHFGDTRYKHYKDKLKNYSDMDHLDEKRRENYRKRHENILLKDGTPAYKDKNQPSYWAYKILW